MSDDFELVMPFVVCASAGGPYDDDAFTAGYRCGLIDEALELQPAELKQIAEPQLLPQLDLLAMRHGYALTSQAWEPHPEDWAFFTFTKVSQ